MQYPWMILFIIKIIVGKEICVGAFHLNFYPCAGSKILTTRLSKRSFGARHLYSIVLKTYVPAKSIINVKFDSEVSVKLSNSYAILRNISTRNDNVIFDFQTLADTDNLSFTVNGRDSWNVPYLKSIVINSLEYCENPVVGYLDEYILPGTKTKQVRYKRGNKKKKKKKKKEEAKNEGCGRRKHLDYTELIVNGATSKPGDWPWHAAIYRRNAMKTSYICGGTLISEYSILTAAHCVTVNKVPVEPSLLSVVLGKYNFLENDTSCQHINVLTLNVHEEFGWPMNLDNDIAMIQLANNAVYDDFVQPACIWYKKAKHLLPTDVIYGTVAGWGFSNIRSLAPQLKQITIPKIKRSNCIEKNKQFYSIILANDRKFCAGWGNGTSPCNGDSGGGFMIFVPDRPKDISSTGAWYIRGILSLAVSFKDEAVCDPDQYVVFTNILKYKDWIQIHTYYNTYQT